MKEGKVGMEREKSNWSVVRAEASADLTGSSEAG